MLVVNPEIAALVGVPKNTGVERYGRYYPGDDE
jgi:hypothetical protein